MAQRKPRRLESLKDIAHDDPLLFADLFVAALVAVLLLAGCHTTTPIDDASSATSARPDPTELAIVIEPPAPNPVPEG